jgi:hypothetical protein
MNKKIDSVERLSKDFTEFESEISASEIQVQGISVWENMRFGLFKSLIEKTGIRSNKSTDNRVNLKDKLNVVKLSLKNLFIKNPFMAGQKPVIFFGHRRRKEDINGSHEDIYCDPIISELDEDYLYLEEPNGLKHKAPKAENVRYLDSIKFLPKILYKLISRFYSLDKEEQEKVKMLNDRLNQRYDVEVDIMEKVRKTCFESNVARPLYKYMLKRIDPEIAIFVVSYGRETQIQACKEMDIPTVELQHGIIHKSHMGYHYPQAKDNFPDYIFTFGAYWTDKADYPIEENKIIPVGYPYLEREIQRYNSVERKDQVLFISQPTVAQDLSKMAAKLSEKNLNFEVIYKLHPSNYDDWEEKYECLEKADVKVIDHDRKPLYQLFKESKTQVGVNSTAIYEGLAMSLETFIVDLPGSGIMDDLVPEYAQKASDAEELKKKMKLLPQDNDDIRRIFNNNSVQEALNYIKAIKNS